MKYALRSAIAAAAVAGSICAGSLGPAVASNVAGVSLAASGVGTLKNYDCGWSIKTKYHSCALAYSLALQWLSVGDYPNRLDATFSPNSGKRYNFKCSGVKSVTCKSNKGTVAFKPVKLPAKQPCGDINNIAADAWLNSTCEFALAAEAKWQATPYQSRSKINVIDPIDGRTYAMICFDLHDGDATACMTGKRVIAIRT